MHKGTLQNLGQVSRPIQSIQGGELTFVQVENQCYLWYFILKNNNKKIKEQPLTGEASKDQLVSVFASGKQNNQKQSIE